MIRHAMGRFSATLAALLILAAGCGDQEPVGAERPSELRVGEVAHAISAPAGFGAGTYARTIGPEGGAIYFGIGRLEFPRGALSQPTLITASVDGQTIGVDFQPHGLVFPAHAVPLLVLTDPQYGSDEGTHEIVYVDEDMVVLEILHTFSDVSAQRAAAANLRHFSPYILAQN